MRYSSWLNQPPGPSARTVKRFGGSQTVTLPPSDVSPPSPEVILEGNSHEALPSPVATAWKTASGVPGSSTSRLISNSLPMSVLLGVGGSGDARMRGDDEPVLAAALGAAAVVAAGQLRHGVAELLGERGAVGGGREADLAVDRERGDRLARPGGAGDQVADVTHQLPG